MSATPKDASGVYVSVVSGTPRLATLPDLTAGSADTASAPPPSFPDALPDGLWAAPPDEQAAAKMRLSAAAGVGDPGPSYKVRQ